MREKGLSFLWVRVIVRVPDLRRGDREQSLRYKLQYTTCITPPPLDYILD